MRLSQALRLPYPPCLAAIGAGGKTSLLFQLGREYLAEKGESGRTVLLTTSTHLANWQVAAADHHLTIERWEQLAGLKNSFPLGLVAITGPLVQDQRLSGLDEASMAWLAAYADEQHLPLLIEADGSRLRPLKAPGPHEPAIPAFARQVVVSAGLSALGKPLTEEWVHRPELFAKLSGLSAGETITVDAVQRTLTSLDVSKKNMLPRACRIAMLTQVDSQILQAQASAVANQILPIYERVIVCRTRPSNSPQVEMACLEALAVVEPVAGIVLAAGGSERYGSPKQLLDWFGKSLVRQVADTALGAELNPVIVVAGAYFTEVSAALDGLAVKIVHNLNWESGQASSIQRGLQAVPDGCGGAVFFLCDQPQVPVPLVRSLVEKHQQTRAPIVAPLIDESRGNPVLFDRDTFGEFASLRPDQGGRALFSRFPVEWLTWHDARILVDIDTPEDYQQLKDCYSPGKL